MSVRVGSVSNGATDNPAGASLQLVLGDCSRRNLGWKTTELEVTGAFKSEHAMQLHFQGTVLLLLEWSLPTRVRLSPSLVCWA